MESLERRLERLEQQHADPQDWMIIAVYYTEGGAPPLPGMEPGQMLYFRPDGTPVDHPPPGAPVKAYGFNPFEGV